MLTMMLPELLSLSSSSELETEESVDSATRTDTVSAWWCRYEQAKEVLESVALWGEATRLRADFGHSREHV